jgi:hypothetical protein
MNRTFIALALVGAAGLFVGCDEKKPEAPKTGPGTVPPAMPAVQPPAGAPGAGGSAAAPSAAAPKGVEAETKAKLTEAQAATVSKYDAFVAASEQQIASLKAQAEKATETTKSKVAASLKPAEAEIGKLKSALSTAKTDGIKDDAKLDALGASAKAAFDKAVKEATDMGAAAKDAASDALKSFGK